MYKSTLACPLNTLVCPTALSGAGLAAVALNGGESLQHGDTWSVVLIIVFAVLCVIGFTSLLAQPQTTSKNAFRVSAGPKDLQMYRSSLEVSLGLF